MYKHVRSITESTKRQSFCPPELRPSRCDMLRSERVDHRGRLSEMRQKSGRGLPDDPSGEIQVDHTKNADFCTAACIENQLSF